MDVPDTGASRPKQPRFEHYAAYCVEQIREIVRRFGPRPAGSEGEREAQRYLAAQLQRHVDRVELEPFVVRPKAFMGFIPVTALLMLLSLVAYGWLPPLGLAICLLAIALPVFELVLYREFIDWAFPKATSQNLVAIKKPAGERRRILLLGGHCDGAYEWRYNRHSRWALLLVAGASVFGVLTALGAHIANTAVNGMGPVDPASSWSAVGWVLWVFAPAFVAAMGWSNFRVVSPGANDNLTGVMLSVALARYLSDEGVELQHTELRLLNTGAEEAGLRGAKAYVRAHREELSATESLYLALDTFRELPHMAVYTRDMNARVAHDPDASALLQRAAASLGLELPFRSVPVGSSDAAAFSQAGLQATALMAMDRKPPRYYHTRLDTPDILDPTCIAAALRVVVAFVALWDVAASEDENPDGVAPRAGGGGIAS